MDGSTEQEFHDFVVTHSPALARLARLLVANPDAAKDLVQVVLLRAWRSWHRVSRAEDPDAYVRKILVNAAVSGRRRRWRGELPTSQVPELPAGDDYQRLADRDYLVGAVRALPPRQRAAVVLRYFCDLDDRAVADVPGCSVATVRSQISRALARLRVTAAPDGQPVTNPSRQESP